jgi:hypothetical protein
MSALDQLESFLQGLLERPAALFVPKGLKPVQLVSALTKALESSARRLPDRIVIASEYRISVSREDFAEISAVRAALQRELVEYVERLAAERELSLPADPEVEIVESAEVAATHPHVESSFPEASAGTRPDQSRSIGERTSGDGPALALLSPDERTVRRFRLDGPSLTLGRRSSNDISLPDLKVSRRHARFDGQGSAWYITDLHSRNGTRVNGHDVNEQLKLKNGDIIELGLQRLRFEANTAVQERRN